MTSRQQAADEMLAHWQLQARAGLEAQTSNPWMEGHRSQQAGQLVTANPFPRGSENYGWWRSGWFFLSPLEKL
jgi:hypothetical protein